MDEKNYFDDNIKSVVNIEKYHFKPSKNIFEEAWKKSNKEKACKNQHSLFYKIKPSIAVCCMLICFIMVFFISPCGRAFADTIKTIFIMEKSGDNYNVVEKSEDTVIDYENIGLVNITSSNKKQMERRLGFSVNCPQKINEEFVETCAPFACLTVYDIKFNELSKLRYKFYEAIGNEEIFNELKEYDKKLWVSTIYSDSRDNFYYLYMKKGEKNQKLEVISEFDIEGVKCKVVELDKVEHVKTKEGNITLGDYKQKPKGIEKVRYITWQYNGVNYDITTDSKKFNKNYEMCKKLVEDYIKILKQQDISNKS